MDRQREPQTWSLSWKRPCLSIERPLYPETLAPRGQSEWTHLEKRQVKSVSQRTLRTNALEVSDKRNSMLKAYVPNYYTVLSTAIPLVFIRRWCRLAVYAHDQTTQQPICTTANLRGNSVCSEQWGSKGTNHTVLLIMIHSQSTPSPDED